MNAGINLVGYARAEMGVGQSCRNAANSLNTAGIPFGIMNYENCPQSKNDLAWVHKELKIPLFNTNLFHINADQMQSVILHYRHLKLTVDRFNIGYWHWELPEFPDEFEHSFHFIDELWVPSTFVYDSCISKSPVPVRVIPHCITVDIKQKLTRQFFHLPEEKFLFLMMYDSFSFQARKNPLGVISAFKKAFQKDDSSVGLVIKVSKSGFDQEEIKKLKVLAEEYPNVYLIEDFLSRNYINNLLQLCDCYVSLHRSEGYGLPLAEAMYLGKSVIATNWSGNVDFMNKENSCLVDYELKKIGTHYGPYHADQFWAEPDIDHGAYWMKKVKCEETWRKQLALKGQNYIHDKLAPTLVGQQIKERLLELNQL